MTTVLPRFEQGEFVPSREVPFSSDLDRLIHEIRAGEAPNIGRFCGYCCAPLGKRSDCEVCGEHTTSTAPLDKIDRELAQIYVAKRKREALFVHSGAWLGILLATGVSIGLIMVLPSWTKAFAILTLVLGGYFAGVFFGNVLAQMPAYRSGLKLFAIRWGEYVAGRSGKLRPAPGLAEIPRDLCPPLRGRCPQRRGGGLARSLRLTARPPPLSLRDISPSGGEIGRDPHRRAGGDAAGRGGLPALAPTADDAGRQVSRVRRG